MQKPGGKKLELGEWMGFPFEPGYEDREKRYLTAEEEVVGEIVRDFESGKLDRSMDIVVDSTGSLIYLDVDLLERLKRHTAFVYFHAPQSLWDEMLLLYSSNPRPILWHGTYQTGENETNEKALARCYKDLIISRDRLYSHYADIMVGAEGLREGNFNTLDLLKEIQSKLHPIQ
ncbi:MAG: shikimate kinase [Syntrophobacteraceae bacterium]